MTEGMEPATAVEMIRSKPYMVGAFQPAASAPRQAVAPVVPTEPAPVETPNVSAQPWGTADQGWTPEA